MKCQSVKCEKEHDGKYGSGKYCSRQCANSRTWSEEDKLKKSNSAKNSKKVLTRSCECLYKLKAAALKKSEKAKEEILIANWEDLSFERLRKRVIWEQNECCATCGISEWRGKKISLELEHKDGNHSNNAKENLEALCPNCHSLTTTWRGRNKSRKVKKISDEDLLISLIENNWNMRQALLNLNLAAKGSNYKRCHRVKRMIDS